MDWRETAEVHFPLYAARIKSFENVRVLASDLTRKGEVDDGEPSGGAQGGGEVPSFSVDPAAALEKAIEPLKSILKSFILGCCS